MIVINYHNIITPTFLVFNDSWTLVLCVNQQFWSQNNEKIQSCMYF
jgi:hypothetical protein